MYFILYATLTNQGDDLSEKNAYQQTFRVFLMDEGKQNKIRYNKELNIHVEDNRANDLVYRIEMDDLKMELCRRLKKSYDFTRRLNYRYDKIQLKVDAAGENISIENESKVIKNWSALKTCILNDYEGKSVVRYFDELDARMDSTDGIMSSMFQYFYFGLLFPNIPLKHGEEWSNKRIVEFSEYEEEKFEEQIIFKGVEDGLRTYSINGVSLHDSETIMEKYEGIVCLTKDTLLPESVDLEIQYRREDVVSNWTFTLNQYQD